MKTTLDYSFPHLNDICPGKNTLDAVLPSCRNICVFLRHEADMDSDPTFRNIDHTAVVFICLSGNGRLLFQHDICELTEGEGILILPLQAHLRVPFPGHKVEFLCIRFEVENLGFLEELNTGKFVLNNEARRYLNSFITNYQKGISENSSEARAKCALFLMLMLNAARFSMRNTLTTAGLPERFTKACHALLSTGMNSYNVAEVARKLGITPNYLRIYFKKVSGKTPRELKKAQLDMRSVQMLLNTDKTIGEIAADLNFCSINNFSRYFKQKNGVSPTQFRKQFRQQ